MRNVLKNILNGGQDSALSWIICIGCAIMYFTCIGVNRAQGVLFPALLKSNPGVDREDVSWPFTLAGAVIVYSAPLTGYLDTRMSMLTICLVGTFLFALGCFPCYFNSTVLFVSIFFGVIRGTGMTLATVAIPGIVNNNFEKYRATAMGITMSGISLGGFVIPLVIQHCLDTYDLETTFLFIGGISFLTALGALPLMNSRKKRSENKNHEANNESNGNVNQAFEEEQVPDFRDAETGKMPLKTVSSYVPFERYSQVDWSAGYDERKHSHPTKNTEQCSAPPDPSNILPVKTSVFAGIRLILQVRGFYIISFTTVSIGVIAGIYSLTAVDYSKDKDIDSSRGVYLLTASAAAEMVGALFLSWLCDKNFVSRAIFLSLNLIVAGSAVVVFVLQYEFVGLLASAVVLGAAQGACYTVSSVIMSEYISKDNMVMAVSLNRCIVGVSYLPRAALIGFFRDKLGSYDLLFYMLAGMAYLSAAMWILEDIFKRLRMKRETVKQAD